MRRDPIRGPSPREPGCGRRITDACMPHRDARRTRTSTTPCDERNLQSLLLRNAYLQHGVFPHRHRGGSVSRIVSDAGQRSADAESKASRSPDICVPHAGARSERASSDLNGVGDRLCVCCYLLFQLGTSERVCSDNLRLARSASPQTDRCTPVTTISVLTNVARSPKAEILPHCAWVIFRSVLVGAKHIWNRLQ
jgi:hypothetical protein